MYPMNVLQQIIRQAGAEEKIESSMPGCEGINIGALARRSFSSSFVTGTFEVVGFISPKAFFFEGYSRVSWAQEGWDMMTEEEKAQLEPGVVMKVKDESRFEIWRPTTARIETTKER